MPDHLKPITESVVMANMGITEQSLERRRHAVGLGPDDLRRIASIRQLVVRDADRLAGTFFEFLAGLDDARVLLGYRELADQARRLKREHMIQMTEGKYDAAYVEQRVKLGLLYGRVGLETRAFLGAFQHLLAEMGRTILRERPEGGDGFEALESMRKVAFFDIGIMIDVLIHERERTIRLQSEAIRELSTPVLQIRERLLLLPLVGLVDTHRAQLITENLLKAIRANRAKVVVMDVTGVATIDSRVANHLLQTVNAARLMGARVIVSGVSAEVAQSLVAIGIELAELVTVGDLQGGIEDAERLLGYEVTFDPARVAMVE
jgi:rsbT co-antagonist protein RsbR